MLKLVVRKMVINIKVGGEKNGRKKYEWLCNVELR